MNICEHPKCKNTADSRFCSKFCARSFSTFAKRKEINAKVSVTMVEYAKFHELFGGKRGHGKPENISTGLKSYYRNNPKTKKWTDKQKVALNREAVHRCRAKARGLLPKDTDVDKVRQYYMDCPDGYEVDHIVPFAKGGFHHQDNLQYLTPLENKKKGSKLIPNMIH